MSTVTAKSTKAEIWNAYQENLSKAKEKAASKPTLVRERQHQMDVSTRASSIQKEDVSSLLNKLRDAVGQDLLNVSKKMEEQLEKLDTVDEQIRLREQELKQVHSIERDADSLAALADTIDEQRAQLAQQKKDQADQLRAEIEEHNKAQDRRKELADYQFERNERERSDELADKLAVLRKKFYADREVEEKDLAAREEAVNKREGTMDILEEEMEGLKVTFHTRVEAAVKEVEDKMKRSHQFAESIIKKDHEAKMAVLQGKHDSLETNLSSATKRISELETDLAKSRDQVQSVALRALDASGNKEAMNQVQTAVANVTSKK